MDQNILVIEDDPDIQELLKYNLEKDGYKVHTEDHGERGLEEAKRLKPNLILLDLMLPGMDGLAICRKLRENSDTSQLPIIMLTAKGEENDIVLGLELGADDYVVKPFGIKELKARIRSALRRRQETQATPIEANSVVVVGPLTILPEMHEIRIDDKPVTLTLAEFKLAQTLASQPGRVFTRNQLLKSVSGENTYVIDRNIDVHIRALRRKFGDHADCIVTIRGIGYKFKRSHE